MPRCARPVVTKHLDLRLLGNGLAWSLRGSLSADVQTRWPGREGGRREGEGECEVAEQGSTHSVGNWGTVGMAASFTPGRLEVRDPGWQMVWVRVSCDLAWWEGRERWVLEGHGWDSCLIT